jgi:hypothetical protein
MRTPAWGFYFDKREASIRAVRNGIAGAMFDVGYFPPNTPPDE